MSSEQHSGIAKKFLLKAEFKIDKWSSNDLPTDVLFTSGALILPGENEPEVLRIKILHYGHNEDREWTIKYDTNDIDNRNDDHRLEHQDITYVYIGNALLGAFPASEEVTINFEILVSRDTTHKYLINIYCDNPRYDEGLNWYYYNQYYDWMQNVPFSQDIMENANVHTEYIIEGENDKYSFEYVYPEEPHYIPVHDHIVAFENSSYFTDSEEYRHNNIYNDGSFGFTVGFGNDQFTYIDYIPITDSFDEKEIQELEGDYSTWSGTTGIGTGYSDSLIMYPNGKFRFVDKLSGNIDITFDLDMFAMNIEDLDNSIEIGLAKVDPYSNYYYTGMKFGYSSFYNEWWDVDSVAVGEVDEDHIYYNSEVISHLSTYKNFFVRLQYDDTTHIMRFWIWKWDEIIDLDNYIEVRIDTTTNNLESSGVKPYISVGGSLLFVHSIFSNTFHYEDDKVLTQLPSMNGQGELGDYYLRYNTNQMLNCTGSVGFVYSTEDGLSSPDWGMDFMPSTDFETIVTNEYYNDTINEWITVGYIKITHNGVLFGNNSDILLQTASGDVVKEHEWNYISLNYYYSPIIEIIDENNVTIREGEFILVINEDEYSFNTSVVVGSGEYRFTLSNSIGSVYYDNIQVFNHIEYFSTLENFEDDWGTIISGGYWDVSINAHTTNLYLTIIGCSIHDGLSNITVIINDNHILRDMWIQSSPFPNLEYHRYPINLNVIGSSPNNILKLRFISQGLTSVYGFSLSTKESVTDILYTAETYNLEEQRVWEDMNSKIVSEEDIDYSIETDNSAIVNPILIHLSDTIDYVLETIDIKEGLTLSGFVKGKGKIVIEEILCRGNYHIELEFTFGEEDNWYEGSATYTVDEDDHIYITASFPLTLFEEDDDKKWQYFEIDLYQALAHIPAYDGETGVIDGLSLKYSTRAFNFDVIKIIPNIQTIEDITEPLYFADFKYSLERSNIGEFPSSESKITIGEEEQTSALWKIKELDNSGIIDIDTIFERAIEPNTIDNYYFMVYADSFSSDTIFIEIDSDLPFTVYQAGIAIYTKNDFKRNNAFIPINVLGGISPILFKIVRPSSHPNHLMRISYIAFGDVSIGGSIFQQNEYITQWLHTQPFSSEVLHNTEGLIALINDICPKKSDRLKTPYGNLEFEQVELTEERYVDFSSDIRFTPSDNEYVILYTNLYFAKELENAELIIQKGLDNNFGFDIKLLTIDSFQMLQNDDSLFNEVNTLSDTFTIPLLDVYTIPTPSIDGYRDFDLLRPRLDEGPIWADPDSVTHHPDNDYRFDISDHYKHTLNLNSKGFHRVLILVEFTDTFQPLNISIRIKNRTDKVYELLEPSPIKIDYRFTLSRLDTIMYESKPFDEVAGGTNVIDNEHVLAGGFFRDDLGGFHNYRIYFLGASDFETLLEVESYYRLDEEEEDTWGNIVPKIYDGSTSETMLASYVLFNMNFAIKIDEGFSNNYINTYSITAGRWWFRTIPDVNGSYEMVTAPAVPILTAEELSQINSVLGSFSLISNTSTDTACYTIGETEIILDGLGQSRANFVYDPDSHGTFTAEGYTIDGYTLMEGDFDGDDIYQSNPATTRVSFNEYSEQYIDLLDLDSETNSPTHYLTFINSSSGVETEIIRTEGLNTKIIINANNNDFVWTLHNKYIEVVPKADADKYKKTYITSAGSFTVYSNNLDNPDYAGSYDVFDKPATIQAIQSKIDLPYEIPLSLSTYEDPEYLDPTKSSFAEWFKKLIIQCFNQEEQLDIVDAMSAAYQQTSSLDDPYWTFNMFNLADYNVQDQVNFISVDISGLNYIDVRILQDVFNLDVMEDRFTDWMEGILDLILSSYDPFDDSPSHSTWYKVCSFIKKAFRIAWSVIKFFWRLLTGFKLGNTGDKPEMYQQRTDYAYTKFHSTFMFFWALIMGNSEGAGMPLSYYTGEAYEEYTVLDEDKCTRTHSILEFDYIWDTYLDHIAAKSISNVNSKQLPFADGAYADSVANSSDPELANMRDWVTSPNYQPEAYNMCERDANIFLWFKSVFLKYGPYSIGVYTKEMMEAGTKPLGFDDNYLIIAVYDDTSADGDSYKWLISLDKHYKLSIDQVYIEFGINELELLTTIEMLANVFPVIALYEDIRDSIIVSNPFFRALSRIQIPMDIVDIFTRVRVISSLVNTAYKNAKLVENSFGFLVNQAQHSLKMRKAIGLSNSLRTAWSYLEYTVFLPWGLFQGSMKLFMKAFGKALIKSSDTFKRLPNFLRSALFLEILIKKQKTGSVFAVIDTFGTRLADLANNGIDKSLMFVNILTPSTIFSQMNEVTASETMIQTSLTHTSPLDTTFSGKIGDFIGSIKGDIDGLKSTTNAHTDRLTLKFEWGEDGTTKEKIDEFNKWLAEKLEYFKLEDYIPGKASGHINSIQETLILVLKGLEQGIEPKSFIDPKIVSDLDSILQQIKKNWHIEVDQDGNVREVFPSWVQHLKTFRDLFTDISKGETALDRWKNIGDDYKNVIGDIALGASIIDLYMVVQASNHNLKLAVNAELTKLSDNGVTIDEGVAKKVAAETFHTLIRKELTLRGASGEVLPMTGEVIMADIVGVGQITIQDGIYKFDINKIELEGDIVKFTDDWGPITMDTKYILDKGPYSIDADNYRNKLVNIPGIDNNWRNGEVEFKNSGKNSIYPSDIQTWLGARNMGTLALFLKSGAVPNYYKDLDIDKLSLAQIEVFLKDYKHEYSEVNLMRILNTFTTTTKEKSTGLKMDPELAKMQAFKHVLQTMIVSGVTINLAFLTKNVFSAEVASVYGDTKIITQAYEAENGKFTIDIDGAYHPSVNTNLLRTILSYDKSDLKDKFLNDPDAYIEAAFMTLVPQGKTNPQPFRSICFVITKGDGTKNNYIIDYLDFKNLESDYYQTNPTKPSEREHILEVHLDHDGDGPDNTGKLCLGAGVDIETDIDGKTDTIIKYNTESVNDATNMFKMVHLDNKKFPNGDTYKTIFISPDTYDLVGTDGADGGFYLTIRNQHGEEIADMMKVQFGRGIVGSDFKTQGYPTSNSYKYQRVFLYTLMTANKAPCLEVDIKEIDGESIVSVAYTWLPVKDSIEKLIELKAEIENADANTKTQLIETIYKYLEKYQGIKPTDYTKHDSVIERIDDTIAYYTDLNDKPRIDCYTQEVDKFNINDEIPPGTEIVSNPYYLVFKQNNVMDNSLLSFDDIISNYVKNVKNVMGAFTGSDSIVGGDGTYKRLLKDGYIKKEAPPITESKIVTFTEFKAEFYRHNAMDLMDNIQVGLIHDVYTRYLTDKMEGNSLKETIDAFRPSNDDTKKGNKMTLFGNFLKNTYNKYLRSTSFYNLFIRNLDSKNNDFTDNILKNFEADDLKKAKEAIHQKVEEYIKTHKHLGLALKENMLAIQKNTQNTKIYLLDKDPLSYGAILTNRGTSIYCNVKLLKSIITKLGGAPIDGTRISWPTKDTLDTTKKIFSNDIPLIQLIYNSYGQNGLDTVRNTLDLFWGHISHDAKGKSGNFNLRRGEIPHQKLIASTTVLGIVEKLNDYSSLGDPKKTAITDLRAIVITVEETKPGIFKVDINEEKTPQVSGELFTQLQKLHYLVPEALVYGGEVPELFNQFNRAVDNFNKPYEQQHRFTSEDDKGPYEVKKNQNEFMHRLMGFINFWAKGGVFGG